MADLKTVSRASLAISAIIVLVYFGDRITASSVVPVRLYVIESIDMFVLLLVMSALIGVSFMIEHHLATR